MLDKEEAHRKLFEAHRSLSEAGKKVHEVIVCLHAAGRYPEDREKFGLALAHLEKARELADEALHTAGKGRTELIRNTGCDGSCT